MQKSHQEILRNCRLWPTRPKFDFPTLARPKTGSVSLPNNARGYPSIPLNEKTAGFEILCIMVIVFGSWVICYQHAHAVRLSGFVVTQFYLDLGLAGWQSSIQLTDFDSITLNWQVGRFRFNLFELAGWQSPVESLWTGRLADFDSVRFAISNPSCVVLFQFQMEIIWI